MLKIEILSNSNLNNHPSIDTIKEFEDSIIEKINCNEKIIRNTNNVLKKILKKILLIIFNTSPQLLTRCIILKSKSSIFSILMEFNILMLFPFYLRYNKKYLYLFDIWPNKIRHVVKLAKKLSIDVVFVSSQKSTEELSKFNLNTRFYWIPEAIDFKCYRYKNIIDKDIDVLQFGRKYEKYHLAILNILEQNNKIYLYEKRRGDIVFSNRDLFIDGLSRTKISICFPSSITHPERSGTFETMTVRYLQSMASKCLIIGYAPKEMISIFGYNPIIEANINQSGEQILSILKNYNSYIDLIEKNYLEVQNHTWRDRWNKIRFIINKNYI